MAFTVAIVGRPNVGKSTLFNRLVGRRLALVDDTPGVTRDRREAEARIGDLSVRLIDTAGLEEAGAGDAAGPHDAADRSGDRRGGPRALRHRRARRHHAERRAFRGPACARPAGRSRCSPTRPRAAAADGGIMEAYSLGFGEPIPISAEHGIGMPDVYDAIARRHAEGRDGGGAEASEAAEDERRQKQSRSRSPSSASRMPASPRWSTA